MPVVVDKLKVSPRNFSNLEKSFFDKKKKNVGRDHSYPDIYTGYGFPGYCLLFLAQN